MKDDDRRGALKIWLLCELAIQQAEKKAHKGDWRKEGYGRAVKGLDDEVVELHAETIKEPKDQSKIRILEEAAQVVLSTMIEADLCYVFDELLDELSVNGKVEVAGNG